MFQNKEIKVNDIISAHHHSRTNNFKCVILDVVNNFLLLKPEKDFSMSNVSEGDPLVIVHEFNKEIKLCECSIIEIDSKSKLLRTKVDVTQPIMNQRLFERYPTSLYAEIMPKGTRKRNSAMIKNMSIYGAYLLSKAEYDKGSKVHFDLHMKNQVLQLDADIVRVEQGEHYFEYGLSIFYKDLSTRNFIKSYLSSLKGEQERFVLDLRNNLHKEQ